MARRPAPFSTVRGAVALLLFLPSIGLAHDLWILPGKYRLEVGEVTRVFVNNGDVFPESLTLLGEHRVREASSTAPAGKAPISEFRVDGKSLTFDFHSNTILEDSVIVDNQCCRQSDVPICQHLGHESGITCYMTIDHW